MRLTIFLSLAAPHDEFESLLRPQRTVSAPRTSHELQAASPFTLVTIERKQGLPEFPTEGGVDFLVAALRPSVTPGTPRYPLAFYHFGYKGSVLCLAPPEVNLEDGTSSTGLLFGR